MTAATTYDETPVYIPADGNDIFAIFTRPTTTSNGICAVLLLGGVFSLSITRNRMSVKLARSLAAKGYHVLRMDFHGVGESTGSFDESRLARPWAGDLMGAVEWLRAQGMDQFVLLGHCFGGRTCLAAAPQIPELKALGLVVVPVMDYNHFELAVKNRSELKAGAFVKRAARGSVLRGMLRPRDRRRYMHILKAKLRRKKAGGEEMPWEQASPHYMGYLSQVIDRRVPLLLAFGTECLAKDFDKAVTGKLGKLLKRADGFLEVHRFDRMAHGFPNLATQDGSIDLVENWLDRVVAPPSPELASAKPASE
ncbi:MAG: alpha/beta fold hydrolase [Actinomycetota bacterium]